MIAVVVTATDWHSLSTRSFETQSFSSIRTLLLLGDESIFSFFFQSAIMDFGQAVDDSVQISLEYGHALRFFR